ncbi:hypothetical protein [Candidatus Macondimonas diazotrophica]|uniref:Uncharacterized protein n=1 Tax=Candidatus Macondimonas diazotrophica TaxID=2305248 RepID=A0A4Z0F587_9GAMM|nr:hypothetical protein [Candidatus Macondimonas diazotrophica]TFZ80728.1 hypothetical protein E4680_13730 [Candidatus Macondimonas diazotrophica]
MIDRGFSFEVSDSELANEFSFMNAKEQAGFFNGIARDFPQTNEDPAPYIYVIANDPLLTCQAKRWIIDLADHIRGLDAT